MPWKCPNDCEDFDVVRDEYREDTIAHFFDVNDKDLCDSTHYKVYVGEDSECGEPECSLCGALVVWED